MIHKAGLLVVRDGKVLLCRKRYGTSLLILPGGRMETGESAAECLLREVREELGAGVCVTNLQYLGRYVDRAAGASGNVCVELYGGTLAGQPQPCSEIREFVWFGEDSDRRTLAPSLARKILPDLMARSILCWEK